MNETSGDLTESERPLDDTHFRGDQNTADLQSETTHDQIKHDQFHKQRNMPSQIQVTNNSSGFIGAASSAGNLHGHMPSNVASVNKYANVNNTNEINPMIMMSGEEGSASIS